MQGLSPNLPMLQNNPTIDQDVPAYIVVEKRGFYDDSDKLWPKGSMIYWEGTPNPGFEPLNELAEEKLREYFIMLDKKANEVAEKRGTGHASLVNAFEARRRLQDMDRKLGRSVNIDEPLPIMGVKQGGAPLARGINDVAKSQIPLMGSYPRKNKTPKAS